jgi:hypothetical protein
MSATVPLRCRCGAVRGVMTGVSPAAGNRVVCHCNDCQAFARFLGQDGIVDARGGTDIFHFCPSQLRITEGAEHLACVRLSESGMFRWYADCCKSPIGNMIGARFPFIGLVVAFIDTSADGKTADALLGAPSAHIWGKFAVGGCPPHVHPKAPPGLLLRSGKLMLGWWLGHRGQPQPFFDMATRAPKVRPRILGKAERAALG